MASTIASLVSKFLFPKFDLGQAWYSLLAFHEHTADAGGNWPGYFTRWDADWSNSAHYSAALAGFSGTEQVFRRAIVGIAAPDQAPSLASPTAGNSQTATIVVFNGLSWRRSGPVEADRLPVPLRDGPLAVIDIATGERIPYEDVPGTRRHIVFFAKNIPSIGYRAYSVTKAADDGPESSRESPLDVTWDPAGETMAIRDRATGRVLTQSAPARPFGSLSSLASRLQDLGPAEVNVTEGAVTRRIEMLRKGSLVPLTVVTLYRDTPYADLRFDIDLSAPRGERGNYAIDLPLAGSQQLFIDGAGFVLRVPQDILPGGTPPQFTPVHFVHRRHTETWGVTLANRDAGDDAAGSACFGGEREQECLHPR